MIRPIAFKLNEQTALDNLYQHDVQGLSDSVAQSLALKEFDDFVASVKAVKGDVNAKMASDAQNAPKV